VLKRSKIFVKPMILFVVLVAATAFAADAKSPRTPATPEVAIDAAASEVVIVRGDKRFLVDLAAGSVHELGAAAGADGATQQATPSSSKDAAAQAAADAQQQPADTKLSYYVPGDVRLMTVPTPLTLPKGGMRVEFTHRFPFEPTFSGVARGHLLGGLDTYAVASFGFDFGIADRVELGIYRSPTVIARTIEMRAAFRLLAERDDQPLNLTARFSVDGQNDFSQNFTTNFELIGSRSLGPKAQFYLVPTVSIHNRPVITNPVEQPCSQALATNVNPALHVKPCANTFSMGIGLAVDVRPTVALFAEVLPTMVNGPELGIHRPPYSFGIQKKIWRHAFTFGFTTAPRTTVAQRIGSRAVYTQQPGSDGPSGLFIGFNLSRQLR